MFEDIRHFQELRTSFDTSAFDPFHSTNPLAKYSGMERGL